MKKMFLFAAAAIVSLSSCVQSETVYTGKVQEMAFKSAVTRAVIDNTNQMVYPIAVSAILNNGTKYDHYFHNDGTDKANRPYVAKFEYNESNNYWSGVPARYWPTKGDLEFLAFCPYPKYASIVTNLNATTGKFESMVIAGIDNNVDEQNDVLYSDLLTATAPDDAEGSLPLFFHHATSQLNMTFKKTASQAEIVLNEVYLSDVKLMGTLTITPTATQGNSAKEFVSTATWSEVNNYPMKKMMKANATLMTETTIDAMLSEDAVYTPTPLLVIPSAQTTINIIYTVDGHQQLFTCDLTKDSEGNTITPAPQWEMGKKYTYNFTIKANEIIFKCTVDEWEPVDGGNYPI